MMKINWLSRLLTGPAFGTSTARLRKRRASRSFGTEEQLEVRILLSSQSFISNVTGLPGSNEEADENEKADEPVEVSGTYLTGQSPADSKPMFFNDVKQGQLDTCIFMSTLSAVALTNFNLANSISVTSQTSGMTTYNVKLWARNAQNQLVLHNRSVQFNFTVSLEDPKPGDSNEYWPAIFQRAYLDLAASVGRNYRSAIFALESLTGAAASSRDMQNSLAYAKQIQTDLLAGRATITHTPTLDTPGYIGGSYGLYSNHGYTVMGIEIPASNSLASTYVTVRNPWATDTGVRFFDADKNGKLSNTEWRNSKYGIDGTNDGLIRLPWSVYAANFIATHVSSRTGTNINSPLPVYSFNKPSPPSVTAYEGQPLRVNLATTHSSGRPVYYLMNSSRGNVHLQDGIFTWEPEAASAGKYAVSVRAFLDPLNPLITTDIVFIVTVLPSGPTIGKATASPTTIKNDGSDLLKLDASSIYSPYSQSYGVEWWLDQDRNNQFNPSVDRWLGVSGSSWQGYLGGLNVGSQTFFARGLWDSFGDTHYGAAKAVSVNVVAAPPVDVVAVPRGGQTALTSSQEDNYAIRTLQDGSGQYRVLSQWEYFVPTPGVTGGNFYSEYRVRLLDKNGTLLQTTPVAEKSGGTPDLFVREDGTFAVIWSFSNSSQASIKLQWYNANGSPQGTPTVIATDIQDLSGGLQVAGDRNGNLLLAYNVGGYFAEDVWALSVSRDGTVTRAPWRVNTHTDSMQKNPTVSLNDDGVGVIAWGDYGDVGIENSSATVARLISNYGLQNGDEIILSPTTHGDLFIDSAVNAAGEFVIAIPNNESLTVKKFSSAGVQIGEAFRANSFLGSYCQNPSFSLNDAGWMAVAWENWRQDGTANNGVGVYAQLFDPFGNRYGGEFAVPVQRDYEQALANVLLDNSGQLHFTWTNGGYLNPLHETVETRMFDVKLPPVIASNQSFEVAENLPAGTVVGTVDASDPNPGNGVGFEIVDTPGFSIDPVTGVIRTMMPLDFEIRKTHVLYVRVTSNDGFAVNAVTVNVLDRIDGTSGVDVLELRFAENNVNVLRSTDNGPYFSLGTFPLTSPLELQAMQSTDTVRVFGTSGNDIYRLSGAGLFFNNTRILLGGSAALQFHGEAGNDLYRLGTDARLGSVQIVETGSGVDTIDFSPTLFRDVQMNLSSVVPQIVNANLTLQLASATQIENLAGGSGRDTLTGNSLANTLTGGAGDDTLDGGAGNDVLIGGTDNDTYIFAASTVAEADQVSENSNEGTDTLSFAFLTTSVIAHLGSNTVQQVHTNRTLKLNSAFVMENLIGGSGADTLFGNSLNNTLSGNAGNDKLLGAAGDDLLYGGADNDTYMFVPATAAEADQVFENLNQGIDTLNFAYLTTSVVVNLGSTSVQQVHTNRTLQLNSGAVFENLDGGTGADTLFGNALNNTLTGGAGDDKLLGAGGNDLLIGGANNDTYMFVPATAAEADQVTENANEGVDTLNFANLTTNVVLNLGSTSVQPVSTHRTLKLNSLSTFENAVGGAASDMLLGNALANRLTGGSGHNILVGMEGSDILEAGSGRDILIGGLGADTLNGGAGEDILIAGRTTSDTNLANLNTLRAQWISSNSYATRLTNLRNGVGSPVVSLKARTNVLNDMATVDRLFGGGDRNWFFRASDDVLGELISGESIEVL